MSPERSLDYAQMVLDNSTDAIVLMDLDYSVLAFNQNLQDTIKTYSGRILKIGDDYRSYVTEQDKGVFFDIFQKAIAGESIQFERHSDHKGIAIWFEYRINPTYDKEKHLLGVCLRAKNIDIRKKMEIKIQAQIHELKEIARIQSHDIRRPLANILGLLELLDSGMPDDKINEIHCYLKESAKDLDFLVCEIVKRTAISFSEFQ